MVDKDTKLDSIIPMAGETISYNFELVNMSKETIDVAGLENYLRPRIINNIKTSKEMQVLRDDNVTFLYRYSDRSNKFVFEIKVTPNDYQ